MMKSNAMILNEASPQLHSPLTQAINGKKTKALKIKKFVFSTGQSVKTVSKREFLYYHSVRLVEGKNESYVEYYYLIPRDLESRIPKDWIRSEWRSLNGQLKQWGRFRVKEDINRRKDKEWTAHVLQSVKDSLEVKKFDPFEDLVEQYQLQVAKEQSIKKEEEAKKQIVTVGDAFDIFLKAYVIGSPTFKTHMVIKNLLIEGLGEGYDQDINSLTAEDLQSMLQEKFVEEGWSKATFNDKVKKITTFLKVIKKKKITEVDVSAELEKKTKVAKTKNTPFDAASANLIKKLLLEHPLQPNGRQVDEFCQVVYYTCTRPDKETRQLKCKDILWDRGLIYIDPERAKGGAGGHIPLDGELAELLKKMGVDTAPPEYYIFGTEYKPGPECFKQGHFSWFFREKIIKPNNLNPEFVPYSWKPTRVIHLHQDGANPYDIQQLCRHESLTQTMDYMRDLGLLVTDEVQKKGRKY